MRRAFDGLVVETAFERGWGELDNGELVQQAESAGFDLLITTDKNLRYQQNLRERRLAILVLWTTNWPALRIHAERIAQAALVLGPGEFEELARPT